MEARRAEKILKKNGYVLIRRIASSHRQYGKPGCPTVTVPFHGSKDLSIGVLKSLEKQTGLSFRR